MEIEFIIDRITEIISKDKQGQETKIIKYVLKDSVKDADVTLIIKCSEIVPMWLQLLGSKLNDTLMATLHSGTKQTTLIRGDK